MIIENIDVIIKIEIFLFSHMIIENIDASLTFITKGTFGKAAKLVKIEIFSI